MVVMQAQRERERRWPSQPLEKMMASAQDSAGTYDLVKDNNGHFPCSGALCPAPHYEPIEW